MLKFQQANFDRRIDFLVEQRDYYKKWYEQSQQHLKNNESYVTMYEQILQTLKQRLVDHGISPFTKEESEFRTIDLTQDEDDDNHCIERRITRRVIISGSDSESETELDSQMNSQQTIIDTQE